MKKLIAVALMLCLLITAAVAEAPVDVKTMSDDELKALYKEVKSEITERKIWESATLPAGIYRTGIEIPEGTYTCISKSDYLDVYIYLSYDKFLKNDWTKTLDVDEGSSFTLPLYGDICFFIDQECTITPFAGIAW